jgi:hypothetical protein
MSDGGKGSSPRPYGVDRKTYEENWDRIFGKKSKNEQEKIDSSEPQTYNSDTDKKDRK